MKTNLKAELLEMRHQLIALERAHETNDENKMFLALAGMRQANVYFGRVLTKKINRRVAKEAKGSIAAQSIQAAVDLSHVKGPSGDEGLAEDEDTLGDSAFGWRAKKVK